MSLIDPVSWSKSWVMSGDEEKSPITIPHEVFKNFGRQDIIALDFLYQRYARHLDGVILNEEGGFNPQLQIASFLGALYSRLKEKFLVLVLCPDELIVKWHYYMSQCGKFNVQIINPNTVPEDFDQEDGIVLLLSFTDMKLAGYLKEYDFFSVVIDKFDEVATKLFIRKLQGKFNIGITAKDFYMNPNQKIQWTMLNWANPGCVGKLADFYEIDNDNFANFRDNYKEWWFKLTWNFCDSFVKPTLEDTGKLNNTLRDWGRTHNLIEKLHIESKKQPTNRKIKSKDGLDIKQEPVKENPAKRAKITYKRYDKTKQAPKKIIYKNVPNKSANAKKKESFRNMSFSSDSSDSNDTIIYENDFGTNLGDDTSDAAENDKPPIGGSTKNNVRYHVLDRGFKKETSLEQNNKKTEQIYHKDDVNKSDDDQDSVSSGEQLLCSLFRPKKKNLLQINKTEDATFRKTTKGLDDVEDFDESDLFLRSVATTSRGFSPLKNRQKSEKFFNKILEKSDKPAELNSFTKLEMELTEKDDIDVPSESDSFFKGIFSDDKKTKIGSSDINEERKGLSVSSSNGHVDVDSLVAEVMEMVGKT